MAAEESALDVLLIDDDHDFASALSRMLANEGFRVRHAEDGEVGIRMAVEAHPDLIILDFMMPTKNGFDVCTELRRTDGLRDVPIVALTAFGQNIGEIYGLGRPDMADYVQEFLEKPVEPNVLLERMASAINVQETSRSPGSGET